MLSRTKNDFQNACNSVKRPQLLNATCELIPGIAAFTKFCYSQHTPPVYNNAFFKSESGLQQVDPLGPLLSSLTLWPTTQKIKTSVPSSLEHTWYIDDGFFAGSEEQILDTLKIIANEGSERGLILRKDKCELRLVKNFPSIDQAVKSNFGEGSAVLGVAVGSKKNCRFLFEDETSKKFIYAGQFTSPQRSSICIRYP